MSRDVTTEVSISDPMTLKDLRWLVVQCEFMDEDSTVRVQGRKEYNQFDVDPGKVTVIGIRVPE